MKTSDLVTILTAIVALASAISAPAVDAVWPGHGTYIVGVLTIAALVAGTIIRTLTNKTGAAPEVIAQDTPVINSAGERVGTNVSTTSTLPIAAPHGAGSQS